MVSKQPIWIWVYTDDCCVFWPAMGYFAPCLLLKIIFFGTFTSFPVKKERQCIKRVKNGCCIFKLVFGDAHSKGWSKSYLKHFCTFLQVLDAKITKNDLKIIIFLFFRNAIQFNIECWTSNSKDFEKNIMKLCYS